MKSKKTNSIEQNLIFNDEQIKDTNCFIFKGHEFPFNRNFFECFKQNKELERIHQIPLKTPEIDGFININDEIITGFIKFVQKEQPLLLNDENVFALNYLGNEYKIQNLIMHTNNYISKRIEHFIIQILTIHQNATDISTENYETILSQNLQDYIRNEKLLSFNIPFLYRILENYHKENPKKQIKTEDYFNFLFRCLDKYGRQASILFSFIDFSQVPTKYIIQLTEKYSKLFDFKFINSLSIQQLVKYRINENKNMKNKRFAILLVFTLLVSFISFLIGVKFILEKKNKTSNLVDTSNSLQNQLDGEKNKNEELGKTINSINKQFKEKKLNETILSEKLQDKEKQNAILQQENEELRNLKKRQEGKLIEFETSLHIVKKENKMVINRISHLVNKTHSLQNQLDGEKIKNEELGKTINSINKQFEEKKLNETILSEKLQDKEKQNTMLQQENDELRNLIKKQEGKLREMKYFSTVDGWITANIELNQTIRGQIEITEKGGTLDRNRSKFVINKNSSLELEESAYEEGRRIESLKQEFTFVNLRGTYFVHAMIIDNFGNKKEIVSSPIVINLNEVSFSFTGRVQSVSLSPGRYMLEVWGASGGENKNKIWGGTYTGSAGKGGYSSGTLTLKAETRLYAYVGGCPNSSLGGWNGGGGAGKDGGLGGGGGTDFSLFGEDGSNSWNNEQHLYSRIIVAGGGGGSANLSFLELSHVLRGSFGYDIGGNVRADFGHGLGGGFGGGPTGGSNEDDTSKGGTLTDGGGFGIGGDGISYYSSGGGGGWYGGYSNSNTIFWSRGGGGGSGFVFNSMTANSYPGKCLLNSSFFLEDSSTIPGNKRFPGTTGEGRETGHSGNGYAKITLL